VGLSVIFAAGLLLVPLLDGWLGAWRDPRQAAASGFAGVARAWQGESSLPQRLIAANRAALQGMEKFETSLEDSSALVDAVRPATLDALLRFGGAGSEEAYVGRDGWLFYRPDVDALMQPSSKLETAARGLAAFAADLAGRGIRLVFVATPGKASIHPEKIARGAGDAPLMPAGWDEFAALLAAAWNEEASARGLPEQPAPVVIDPSKALREQALASGQPQYLLSDSHWSPAGMELVAAAIAGELGSAATSGPPAATDEIDAVGDTARMLQLPDESPILQKQRVLTAPVKDWAADRSSGILLLGDSYTNIYSSEDLGWGTRAGLAERVSHWLGAPVDRLSRNDAGALEARRMLAAEATKDPAWLEGKDVLVWQLSLREVVGGDWTPVELAGADAAKTGSFLVVPPAEPREVIATVVALGPVPKPGNTPYRDYLTAVHLSDLQDADGKNLDGDALAYVFTMRDNQLLPAADLQPGARARVRLVNYDEQAAQLDPLNRGELDDVDLMLETPNFAEWISPVSP
jgi:alginate O-acetyltransferase complex protein AlgJ